MRYRVDTPYGYVSFDETDRDKAYELYELEGLRLVACLDIHDPGIVIEGVPAHVKRVSE
jgi:hypothetical protein